MSKIPVDTKLSTMIVIALSVFSSTASSQVKPVNPDGSEGLGGTPSIAASTGGVIDKSYVLSNGPGQQFHLTGSTIILATFLQDVEAPLPKLVVSFAEQYRSYNRGPAFSVEELSLSNFPYSFDASYQHFEGGLRGDSFGFRKSLFTHPDALSASKAKAVSRAQTVRSVIQRFPTRLQVTLLNSNWTLLKKYVEQSITQHSEFSELYTILKQAVLDLDDVIAADNPGSFAALYGRANLTTNYAAIAGYTNFNGITISNVGLSVSRLFPLAKLTTKHGINGLGALISAQQLFVRVGPGQNTAVMKVGAAITIQDRTASQYRPKDRWSSLFGIEYSGETALDQSGAFDLFYRYRPYYHGKSTRYVPEEFTVFGGVGSGGYGFIGAKVGFGISL